jgi:hypothetical protein
VKRKILLPISDNQSNSELVKRISGHRSRKRGFRIRDRESNVWLQIPATSSLNGSSDAHDVGWLRT